MLRISDRMGDGSFLSVFLTAIKRIMDTGWKMLRVKRPWVQTWIYVDHYRPIVDFFLKKSSSWLFSKKLLTSSSLSSSPFVLRVDMLHSIWLESSLINSLYILTRTGIDVHCSGAENFKFIINYFPINPINVSFSVNTTGLIILQGIVIPAPHENNFGLAKLLLG